MMLNKILVFFLAFPCLLIEGMSLNITQSIETAKNAYSSMVNAKDNDSFCEQYGNTLDKVKESLISMKKILSDSDNEEEDEEVGGDESLEKACSLQSNYELLLEDLYALSANGKYGKRFNDLRTEEKIKTFNELKTEIEQ